jgi:murein DD-endopeptidase MepM/ murein hydrolase activator NlpD
MNSRCFNPPAWLLVGFIFFAVDASFAEVALSSAPLQGATTGAGMAVVEPFVNPFGTKMPHIVSGFGKREVPAQLLEPAASTGVAIVPVTQETHDGVDYAAFAGSAVRASRSGKVIFAGFSKMYVSRADKTQQHRLVIIRHPDGMSTRYVHLSNLHVKPGQDVQSGQILGILAESDEWKEPVLHFEIRDLRGQPLNPRDYVDKMPAGSRSQKP